MFKWSIQTIYILKSFVYKRRKGRKEQSDILFSNFLFKLETENGTLIYFQSFIVEFFVILNTFALELYIGFGFLLWIYVLFF